MKTTTPVIDISNLVKNYGILEAVNGLTLQVEPGRCYGFLVATAPVRPPR